MPAARCSKTLLAALLCTTAGAAPAVESQLSDALSVPAKAAAAPQDAELPDAFWTENLTTFLRGRFSESAPFDPASLIAGLAMFGVDAAKLSSPVIIPRKNQPATSASAPAPQPAASSRPVLAQSVCQNSHPIDDERKALLVTVPLSFSSARRAALLFSWLRAAPPRTPVLLCALASDSPGASHRAAEEILVKARERRLETGFNGFAGFSGHLDWSGDPSHAYVNFAGLQSVTMDVTDNYLKWQETQAKKTNAFMAVTAVKTALLDLPLAFKRDRMTPYTATEFSAVRCRRDWQSLLKSSCAFSAIYSSRSKVALNEAGEATYSAAQKTIKTLNAEDKQGARRNLSVMFPENYSFAPAAQKDDFLLVKAWKTRFSGLSDAQLSSRFAVTPAVVSAAAGLPALALGTAGEASAEATVDAQSAQEKAVLGLLNDLTSDDAYSAEPDKSASTRSQ